MLVNTSAIIPLVAATTIGEMTSSSRVAVIVLSLLPCSYIIRNGRPMQTAIERIALNYYNNYARMMA